MAFVGELFDDREVVPLRDEDRPIVRERSDKDHVVITSEESTFLEAYRYGLACMLSSSIEAISVSELVGRRVVLASPQFSSDEIYRRCEAIEGVWTTSSFEKHAHLLAAGCPVSEVFGRPDTKPPGKVSAHPGGKNPFYTKEDGMLQKLIHTDEGDERKNLLNCFPVPVDRIEQNGERFFTVQLEQGDCTSTTFELTAETKTSYQTLMECINRAGETLPNPPARLEGNQRDLKISISQIVSAQWPDQVEPAHRSDHWGRVSVDEQTAWLFEDHVYTPSRGLCSIRRDEIHVDDKRLKATPRIDQAGPELSKSDVTLEDIESVVAPAHSSLQAKLVSSYLALCAANVLPSGHRAPHYLLFLVGSKGSGKSTLAELMLACFGQNTNEGLSSLAASTEAGMLAKLGAYHDLPVGFDEYRNEAVDRKKNALLRQAYDKGNATKGTTQKNEQEKHPLRAIPIVVGEHAPDDRTGALLDRGLILKLDTQFEGDTYDDTRELIERASGLAPRLYQKFVDYGDEAYAELRTDMKKRLGDHLEELGHSGHGRRVRLYANLLAAREVTMGDADKVEEAFLGHLLDSADIIDDFALEQVFFRTLVGLASRDSARIQNEIAHVHDGSQLRLHGTTAFQAFQEQTSRQHAGSEASRQDILNHLKNFRHSWFIGNQVPERFHDKIRSCWAIDLEASDVPKSAMELAKYAKGDVNSALLQEA
jgi:hypothetical protein